MSEFWNEFHLKKPPFITVPIKGAQFVDSLRPLLNTMLSPYVKEQQTRLAETSALISRLIARRKNSFQKMKGFKSICKLNSALCRLLRVDLPLVIENFRSTLPDLVTDPQIKTEVPSRNNFVYVLARIIGVYKIHERISECCLESAEYITQLLRTNYFIEINTLLLGVIAKIWKLSYELGNDYTKVYKQLIPYRNLFPESGKSKYLSNDYVLPEKLEPLIKIRKSLKLPQKVVVPVNANPNQVKLTIEKKTFATMVSESSLVISKLAQVEDVGMAISRDSMKPVFDIGRLYTIEDVNKFIVTENESRRISPKTCTTKHILNHEWLAIQKLVQRKILANDDKKALSIFRKFMSNKI